MSLNILINFDVNDPDKSKITTNASRVGVEEILENWLRDQMGKGKDTSQPNEKDSYSIKIQFNLSNDTFKTESDTGNKSLTCGIVQDVFKRLDNLSFS